MSLLSAHQKLTELADTPSTNAKIVLLKKFLQDKIFLTVVKFALNNDLKYHIKSLPKFSPGKHKKTNKEIFCELQELSSKPGASNSDKQRLAVASSIDPSTYEVVKRIINKDLKCGISAKSVNKARPGTVFIVPYCRCSTDKKINNITYPAIIQEKADGMFVNVMINKKGQIKIITRNGKTVHQLEYLKKIIQRGKVGKRTVSQEYGILHSPHKDECLSMVYTGELLVKKEGKILSRKTGNGILISCLHGTATPEDAVCVVLRVWDCLPLKAFYKGHYDVTYNTRILKTAQFVNAVNDKEFVSPVMTKWVNNYEEAQNFYAEIRGAGGEGAILKNLNTVWKDHTSPGMIKLKNVEEAELEIVNWASGKKGSKYELCMGALQCQSSCGELKVSVGSGFSDEERGFNWDKQIGSIITVEFESVITDKRRKGHSLFLPRFVATREERSVADSLKEIMER